MAALMQATSLVRMAIAKLKSFFADRWATSGPAPERSPRSCTLDLSRSRVRDAARQLQGSRETSANFQLGLKAILKDLGVFDDVTFTVEPISRLPYHPDCRHVVLQPNGDVSAPRFRDVMSSVKARAEFDARRPWWVCSLGEDNPRVACMIDRRPAHHARCVICGRIFADDPKHRDVFAVFNRTRGRALRT